MNEARELLRQGRARAALEVVLPQAKREATNTAAWQLAGIAALQAGEPALARDALLRALALAPQDAETHSNLAAACLRLARYEEAAATARQALALAPHSVAAAANLSNALQALGELDGAVAAAESALAIDPSRAETWNNIGNLHKEQGRLDQATAAYARALELQPQARAPLSNWLAALKLDPAQTPATLLAAHREFSRRFEWPLLARYRPPATDADPARRLRIAYVSPDCHSAVPAFLRPVWRAHDEAQFEVFAYFNNPQREETDAQIARKLQVRIMRGRSDEEVAAQIRAEGIDILIDIAGHTGHNRLGVFMLRPAPIQITWLDYLGSTGLEAMDYRLSDAVADPPQLAEAGHSETLLRLPRVQWCWEPPAEAPPLAALPMRSRGYLTLGSFNNYPKLTDATLTLWKALLEALPQARLRVVGAAAGSAQKRLVEALGVAPERLDFLPRLAAADYRQAIGEVDLALDPLPFSGATTTLDALWQGVPVITLPGTTSASRSSASLMSALDLPSFIARDAADYLAIARRWASDAPALADLRAGLRQRLAGSAMLDAQGFTRDLEQQLRETWSAYCAAVPETFALSAALRRKSAGSRWRGADLLLREAEALLASGAWDEAAAVLRNCLSNFQNWQAAQSLLASAALAWAKAHPESVDALWAPPAVLPSTPEVSTIICSIDEAKLAAASASFARHFASLPHELIAIRDARSLAEGYNRGAQRARGEILIFSHDDIELLTPDFALRLLAHLADCDALGVCGTQRLQGAKWDAAGQPHLHGHVVHRSAAGGHALLFVAGAAARVARDIVAIDGVFMAMRRGVWAQTRFDEVRYDGFHLYDLDFCLRASAAGFRFAVPLDLSLAHFSTGRYDRNWASYARRFEEQYQARLAAPAPVIPGSLQGRLSSLEQMRYLLAGLWHFRYGAPLGAEEERGC